MSRIGIMLVLVGGCTAPRPPTPPAVDEAVATPHRSPETAPQPVAKSTASPDRCVPVASCQVFPALVGDECTRVRSDGTVELNDQLRSEQVPKGWLELNHACPGDPGVQSLSSCLEFVELRASCTWRPMLRDPSYRCEDTGTACRKAG